MARATLRGCAQAAATFRTRDINLSLKGLSFRGRSALALLAAIAALCLATQADAADASSPADAAAALARKYAPVMQIAPSDEACEVEDDFLPAPVEVVLGNPKIELRERGRSTPVLRGPTATQLAGRGPGFYLDYPGTPGDDSCQYAVESDRLMQGRQSVVYAVVTQERGKPGLALQYWFYYYFDVWVNVHEGDWEMIQLLFPGSSPEQALREDPSEVAYAQHGGGERAAWNDRKLQREGTHPLVYVAPGSHASYYTARGYFGVGGCDDTSDATRRVDPLVEVLPLHGASVPDRQAWVTFEGLWGDPRGGPPGPLQHEQWERPVSWQRTLSRTAIPRPNQPVLGSGVADAFCPLARELGVANLGFLRYPPGAPLVAVALAAGALAWATQRRWTSLPSPVLRAPHSLGEIALLAPAVFVRHPVVFLPIALPPVLFALATVLVTLLAGWPNAWLPEQASGLIGLLTLIAGAVLGGLMQAAVVAAVDDLAEGRRAGAARALRRGLSRLKPVLLGELGTGIRVAVYLVTIVGAPWALKRNVDWAFTVQAATLGERGPRAAWRRSAQLVKGSWRRVFVLTTTVWILGLTVPVAIGLPLLPLFADMPEVVEVFAVLAYTLLAVPMTIGATLLYLDLETRRSAPTEAGEGGGAEPVRAG
jgi:hypothetical protein